MAAKARETRWAIHRTRTGYTLRATLVVETSQWIQLGQGINGRPKHHRSPPSLSPPEPQKKGKPRGRAKKRTAVAVRGSPTRTAARGGAALAGRCPHLLTGAAVSASRRRQVQARLAPSTPATLSKLSPPPAISSTTATARSLPLLGSLLPPKGMTGTGQLVGWASSTGPCLKAGKSFRGRRECARRLSRTRRSSGGRLLWRQR